jgi:hypothetical protein
MRRMKELKTRTHCSARGLRLISSEGVQMKDREGQEIMKRWDAEPTETQDF